MKRDVQGPTSIISELGRTLTDRWKAKGYGEWEFPSLAAVVLEGFGLEKEVDRIFDHVFVHSDDLSLRDHGTVDVAGLYSTAHFDICLHVWTNGLAPLHHHSWSGVYQVLRGSSTDAKYAFREERRLAAGFSVGQLRCLEIRDISAGTIQLVEPGPDHIHTLSYNEPVSLTISVRSRRIPGQKSMDYWRPGVAIETERALDYERARGKCIQYLATAAPRELSRRLRDLISASDVRGAFLGLEALHRSPARISVTEWRELVELGKEAHGPVFERVALAARETRRPLHHRRLASRAGVEEIDLRRFLSSLFVCPDRETCLARASLISGDAAPLEKCQEWCRRIVALDSGDDILDGDDDLGAVLNSMVSTGSIERSLEALSARYEVDDEDLSLARAACEHFQSHPALTTLFG